MCNIAIPFTLIAIGTAKINSYLAAMLMSTTPISGSLLAHFFTKDEKITLLKSIGIILGFWINYLQIVSTGGLALLMLFGVVTRIWIKDNLSQTLPALLYCLLNIYLCLELISVFYSRPF